MALNLINDFRAKNRIYGDAGAYFASGPNGVSIDTSGKILSAGTDLLVIFSAALGTSQNLTFGTNLSATSPTYNPGQAVTVRVTDTPTFASVTATTFKGALDGNANTATRWQTARTYTFTGDVSGNFTTDGSTNIASIPFRITSLGVSANWNSVYSHVNATSANWSSVYSHVNATSANWSSVYSQVNTNSANWNTAYSQVNSNSTNWNSVYSHVNATSANWSSVYSQVNATSANWNSVYSRFNILSGQLVNTITAPATQGRITYTNLSGGTANVDINNLGTTGSPTFSNILITNNATVAGNLSVAGSLTFLDTSITMTSALSVVNLGTGPALYVEQGGVGAPVARFVDREGGQVLIGDTGNVSIGFTNGTERLNVGGNILATNITLTGITAGTTENTVLLTSTGGVVVGRVVDTRIFQTDSRLVDNGGSSLTTNRIPKASDGNTLTNSNLLDNGTVLSALTPVVAPEFRLTPSGSTTFNIRKDAFYAKVGTAGTTINTFQTASLKGVKFFVTLISGSSSTVFEINGTGLADTTDGMKGTVYGIVDSTGTSQLVDVDLKSGGTNLQIALTAAFDLTDAIIDGTGFYTV